MFKKVLVAEDIDSINHSVASVLKELGIPTVVHAQYCDKAWLMAKKALLEKAPFDLLICDLSFKKDHRDEKISSGNQLIALLKQEDPRMKVLVHSIDDRPRAVNTLWDSGNIDGYVCKDRKGLLSLKEAVIALAEGKDYYTPGLLKGSPKKKLVSLSEFELNILNYIANGLTQDEIQERLKQKNISPNSKSSVEKRLKELREEFSALTTAHLIGIVKDLNLI